MSPRSRQQLEEIRGATKEKLFDSALKLFAIKGYTTTSISDIVKEAGVSKGLVYHYFDSKEDLLRQMIESFEKNEANTRRDFFSDDPQKMLENIITFFFQEMKQNFAFWRLLANLALQIENFDFVKEKSTAKMKGYLTLLETLLGQLGWSNPREEAMILSATFEGIGLQYIVLKEAYHLNEIEQALINKYLRK